MKIGDVAQRAGVSARALRYYEEQGLLRPLRAPSGQRVYQESDIDRIRMYQEFYAAGLTSSHIAKLLPCFDSGHTDADQRAMLHDQRDRIQQRVDELASVLTCLDQLLEIVDQH